MFSTYAQHLPRQGSGVFAVSEHDLPVHDDSVYALGALHEAALPARQIVQHHLFAGINRVGIEDHQVRGFPGCNHAPIQHPRKTGPVRR